MKFKLHIDTRIVGFKGIFILKSFKPVKCWHFNICEQDKFEPRSEKTGLRGFQPGPTQTGLCSHRIWLEP